MSVVVRYFAGLREQMGRQQDELDAGSCATVAEVWKAVSGSEVIPDNLLSAVNLEYVASDHPVIDGDEVAFFPPVTGG
jgi:molybdopterin synthase sulfur carrier subunit